MIYFVETPTYYTTFSSASFSTPHQSSALSRIRYICLASKRPFRAKPSEAKQSQSVKWRRRLALRACRCPPVS
jgi:hypothetical protein